MLNKKIAAVTAAVLVATAGSANASFFNETKFNVGGELAVLNKPSYRTSVNGRDLSAYPFKKKTKLGANVFVGARFNEYFGAELGLGFVQKRTVINNAVNGNGVIATNKTNNVYVDALGFMPVASKVSLVGAVGVGFLKDSARVSFNGVDQGKGSSKRKMGFRVGAGAQYDFNENVAARAMVRYQKGNKRNWTKSNTSVTLGALYTF